MPLWDSWAPGMRGAIRVYSKAQCLISCYLHVLSVEDDMDRDPYWKMNASAGLSPWFFFLFRNCDAQSWEDS